MITSTHDLRLVALSLLIAVLASYTALDLAGRVTVSQGRARINWLIGGAIAMGIGIWSMHFVAMLAFHLSVPINYDIPTVLLSILPAVIASFVALLLVSRSSLDQPQLLGGGVFMGLAIASMHYIGMVAMRVEALLQYNPLLVVLSVGIAISASCVALWLAFVLRGKTTWNWQKLGSAVVMGAAIGGMHYTAMAAAHFTRGEVFRPAPSYTPDTPGLATAIGMTTLLILGLTLLVFLFNQCTESALQKANEELEIKVEERTSELKQAIEQLQGEIAERKQAESALQQSEARFRRQAQLEELLNRLATQIRNSLDLDTILETTVHAIREVFKIDRCLFVWYVSGQSQPPWEVVKEAKSSVLPSQIGDYGADAVGPVADKLLDRKLVQVDNVRTLSDPVMQQFLLSVGYTCLLALPIQTRCGDIGALICGHYREPRPWSDSEVELLQAVVLQLAIAIDQADLYAQAQKAALVAQAQAHQVEQTLHQLQNTQAQLVQSEKMSSLGQLVAGVAHEINNPVSFITGNLTYATQYIQELLDFLRLYQQHYPQPVVAIQEQAEAIDLEFLIDDLPKMVTSMQLGADRISQIVLSLRKFSRLDEVEMKQVNLHEGIDNTLLILQHRLKPNGRSAEIQIVKHYGDLPLVECYPGQLNQVFMNILSNAIDALEEKRELRSEIDPSPVIEIRTEVSPPGYVTVQIADNGSGMTEAVKARLFDPFFTTKPVGTGTGLGLSISYQIVVEKHKGVLKCLSEPGLGTEFWIEIPLQQVD